MPAAVHVRDPLGVDLDELLEDFRAAGAGLGDVVPQLPAGAVEKSGRREVLFKGNGAHDCLSVVLARPIMECRIASGNDGFG